MRDMFARQLLQFAGVTPLKAAEIIAHYPTVQQCVHRETEFLRLFADE